MTHQYESEILFKLMERDGFNIPSSVPPYESEIKAYLINQVKNAYPKLTDYEAEWLLYNYTKHLPADFPISSVTNATIASFENVVPFAYQSAILKGQTLVNLFKNKVTHRDTGKIIYVEEGDKIQATFNDGVTNGWIGFSFKENVPFEIGKTYTVMNELYKGDDQLNSFNISLGNKTFVNTKPVIGINKLKIIIPSDYTEGINWMYYNVNNTNNSATIFSSNLLILEGDYTNVDIPYFEGMQSVKMPVLKTTGKNLFNHDSLILNKYQNNSTYNYSIANNAQHAIYKLDVKANTTYSSNMKRNGVFYDINNQPISWFSMANTVTTPNNCKYMIINFTDYATTDYTESQLEENSIATTYEPFKSNILTVNEPIELRGIGDVQDTLDLMTGEVTERIGEVVLDGSDVYGKDGTIFTPVLIENARVSTTCVSFTHNSIKKLASNNAIGNLKCDKLKVTSVTNTYANEIEGVSQGGNGQYIQICLNNDKLSSYDLVGVQAYLKTNPITVQYELETESIKTVDLKTINENGESVYFMPLEGTMHVSCNSQTIQPTFDMSVPVEATTQNLASFIDLEMEE